jgi:hypothetical protein
VEETDALTPQKLVEAVEEERQSRNLFSASNIGVARKAVAGEGESIVEFFAVVAWGQPHHVVQYAWPPGDAHKRINYFSQFCLPFGSQEAARNEEFVLTVSSESNERLVCVCAVVTPPAAQPVSAAKLILGGELMLSRNSGHRRSLSSGDAYDGSVSAPNGPKCFVLVSKFPFVPVLLHVVRGLVEDERKGGVSADAMQDVISRLVVPVPEIDETVLVRGSMRKEAAAMQWTRRLNVLEDEETQLSRWNAGAALAVLCPGGDPSVLIQALSAIMTERQVLVVGSQMEQVSAACFYLLELIRPFVYQAVFVAVLPPALMEVLEAPVPFVVGLHSSALSPDSRIDSAAVVVNLDSAKVSTGGARIPRLPHEVELRKTLATGLTTGKVPEKMMVYWDEQFGDFRKHCFRDLSNPDQPVTIFVDDAFIAEKAFSGGEEFFKSFFKTQVWSSYSDEKRTRFDLQRRNSLLSARMVAQAVKKK